MPIEIKNKTIETLEKEISFLESENVRLKSEKEPLIDIWGTKNKAQERFIEREFKKQVPFFDDNWIVEYSHNRKSLYIQHIEMRRLNVSWSTIEIDIREDWNRKYPNEKHQVEVKNSLIRNSLSLLKNDRLETFNYVYLLAQVQIVEKFLTSDIFDIFLNYSTHAEFFFKEYEDILNLNSEIYKNEQSIEQLRESLNKEKTSIIEIFLSSAKENQYVLLCRDRLEKVGTSYENSFAFLIGKQTPKSIFIRDFYINRDSRAIRMNNEEKYSKENYILRRLSVYNELLTFKEFQELIGLTFQVK